MKKTIVFSAAILLVLCLDTTSFAHFGMVIPSDTMIMQGDSKLITLNVSFSHPFEFMGMDMARPKAFGIVENKNKIDLLGQLQSTRVMSKKAWLMNYKIKRPGLFVFYVEPEPYWEPAEDCFIIHYTKTVVTAFGNDDGWDREIGLKTEIVPLSKPFGLYTGNVFQGIVKLNQKPVPYAEVEIEYFNETNTAKAPSEYMITQTIKADQNGVFTYAAPKGGWWGFSALNTAEYKMNHQGKPKDVELGAVIWVKFHDWNEKP